MIWGSIMLRKTGTGLFHILAGVALLTGATLPGNASAHAANNSVTTTKFTAHVEGEEVTDGGPDPDCQNFTDVDITVTGRARMWHLELHDSNANSCISQPLTTDADEDLSQGEFRISGGLRHA